MHKDRLILLLLLTVFALVGAECRAPWEEEDEKKDPLPDRAFASTPLLRAYYDTRTFPRKMRDIKIPEGDEFEDEHLTIKFEMGGAAVVDEVRTHMYLMPPKATQLDDVELICRCVAPDGTASAWKPVDAATSNTFDPQMEVTFQYEFDGKPSDGTWSIQIKDYLEDGDGRCVFRNASLHINGGDAATGGNTSENDTLTGAQGNYGPIPEERGIREPFDIGHFGTDRMLLNEFTFASTFYVRSFQLRIGAYVQADNNPTDDNVLLLVAPSGNWMAFAFPDATESVDFDPDKLEVYDIGVGSLPNARLMNLNGELSTGTWSLYLVDNKKDSNIIIITTDEATPGGVVANGAELSLTLFGQNP
ncbi:MAG: hypothetical protein K8I27_03100 [Planctomycetes bacterium]|nr:hypothetical protein [Planctomycetota bacterium]